MLCCLETCFKLYICGQCLYKGISQLKNKNKYVVHFKSNFFTTTLRLGRSGDLLSIRRYLYVNVLDLFFTIFCSTKLCMYVCTKLCMYASGPKFDATLQMTVFQKQRNAFEGNKKKEKKEKRNAFEA
jgi:hypothetical protein